MFEQAKSVLDQAVQELKSRGVEPLELLSIREDVEWRMREPHRGDVPQFIPCDLRLCARNTIVNYWHKDQELVVPAGYVIQPSATRPESFAKPYYIDPVAGRRRCKGLFALERYHDRQDWLFDLSFVGNRRSKDSLRGSFLEALQSDFIPQAASLRLWIKLNDHFFFDERITPERHDELNARNRYIEAIRDSKFVLCPRGNGTTSIRFFETLAACNVPIFIGGSSTKFPLDWIINWDAAVFRISEKEVNNGGFVGILTEVLDLPTSEINARRRYIFRVYHQFLSPERKPVFEILVWLRAAEMLMVEEMWPELLCYPVNPEAVE